MKRSTIFIWLFAVTITSLGQERSMAFFDNLLSRQILKAAHIGQISLIDNICVTESRRIMLASKDSLYLIGYGGYVSYRPKEGNISLFTTSGNNAYYLNNRKLINLSSQNGEKTVMTLSFSPKKVWAGREVVYASSIEKGKYGLWAVFPSNRLQKKLHLLNDQPVSVFEHGGIIYVVTSKELLLMVIGANQYATIPFPQKLFSQVYSAAIDHQRETLYLSSDKGLFRFYEKEFQKVSNDNGTLCYDQDGLLLFNDKEPSIMRIRNNFLYPEKEVKEVIIELK